MIATAFARLTPQDEHLLLSEPQLLPHVKPLVVGHWGTTPGHEFIYVHLNPVIKERELNMIYIAGPGLSGPPLLANIESCMKSRKGRGALLSPRAAS
jgi:phosphoketolase